MFDMESLAIQRTKNNLNMEHAKAVHQMFKELIEKGLLDSEAAKIAFQGLCMKLDWHL